MTAITEHLKHRVEQTRVALDKARARLAEARNQEEALTAELSAYERTLQAELKREGKPASQQPLIINEAANKTDLALNVIRAGGSQGVSVDDLARAFKDRGQELSRNYVFNIVSRLKQQTKIEVRDGRYYAK